MDTIIHKGNEYKLSCNLPPMGYNHNLMALTDAPGFRVWSTAEIQDALRVKPKGARRKQFAGSKWIVDQGQVGSCCPTNSTGALRRSMAINGANEVPILNAEYLYSKINRGQDGGALLADAAKALQTIGVPVDTPKHRFNQDIFSWNYGPQDDAEAAKNKAEAIYYITSEAELLTLLLSNQGAAVVAVHVGNNFNNLDAQGRPGATPNGPGNHCTGVQDVDLDSNFSTGVSYDMFNSWTTDWGIDGYCNLDWNRHLSRTVTLHQFYAVLAPNTTIINNDSPIGV